MIIENEGKMPTQKIKSSEEIIEKVILSYSSEPHLSNSSRKTLSMIYFLSTVKYAVQ